MSFTKLLTILIYLLNSDILAISAVSLNKVNKCAYVHTVNLTNHQKFENGSYLFQGILIPPERQALYDNYYFKGKIKSVPEHVRGCVCDKHYSCLSLCCERDEYYDETRRRCEKLRPFEQVFWELPVVEHISKYKVTNILNKFIIQKYYNCWKPEALHVISDNWTLYEDGILLVQNNFMDNPQFCLSPHLATNNLYTLKPFTCRFVDDGTRKKLLNEYNLNLSLLFLIPTVLVYLVFKELRMNLADKLYFRHILSMTLGNVIFSFLNILSSQLNVIALSILGFCGYIFHIVAILWLSVLCYDIWVVKQNPMQLIIYNLYVGLSTLVAFAYVMALKVPWIRHNVNMPSITDMFLWNTDKWSALHFYGATVLILLFSCAKFIHLMVIIHKERSDVIKCSHNKHFLKQNAIFIMRLFLTLGIPWFFHILSYYVPETKEFYVLFLLTNFADGIQAIVIFSMFVSRKKIWNLELKRSFKVRTATEDCLDPEMTDSMGQT